MRLLGLRLGEAEQALGSRQAGILGGGHGSGSSGGRSSRGVDIFSSCRGGFKGLLSMRERGITKDLSRLGLVQHDFHREASTSR